MKTVDEVHDSIDRNLAELDRMLGQQKWRKTRGRAFNPRPFNPAAMVPKPTGPPMGLVLELRRRNAPD